MKSENFVVIQGWMCNELELKGNDLLVFALIYGFSQDGESKFSGSRNYIASTFNISKPTVDKAIQNLLDKQYIIKHISGDITEPNTYWVNLDVVKKLYWGGKETLLGGGKETLLNNTNKQTTSKKEKVLSKDNTTKSGFEFGKTKPKSENLYTKCVSLVNDYTTDEKLHKALIDYLRVRLEMKDKPLYTNSWKGLLNKLDRDFDASERLQVVYQSIERGYASFFPINSYSSNKNKPWESGVDCTPYTKEELAELEELDRQREAQGLRTRF